MPKGQSHLYTEEQKCFLQANCSLPRKELTRTFNEMFTLSLTEKAISSYCKRHGWLTGRNGQYVKGSQPWNTGTKGVCKPNKTSFKPGQTPSNSKPLGHERICPKDGHILIKVDEPNPYTDADTRYRPKHHVVWEKHHGSIPDGHVVRFKDGNNINCDIDNLECVSKSVNLRMNRNNVNSLPSELKEIGATLAKLEVATFEAMKK
ncbi:HNH endonuclease signature motif containing protein [Photobacterium sp. OFAV2-7]|uniref:HNH endonuclease signature motif containing protein n=1 Tax=Photobacterium sp. OFAV2-7 TaxID=2917748 RepID=UPI001EF6A5A0|nr:HNH endonuclease signature motif containing protein [Photobacterium sp. OFAV2-7]MCG7586855.1 HNH endonuclease [Photobacterium sp. OFAV2-7]